MISLGALNTGSVDEFVAALDGVFEHAPWVAARAAPRRPFPTLAALHQALMQAVRDAAEAEQLAFLGAHPELSADRLPAGLTAHSEVEQRGLAMAAAAGSEALPGLNRDYRARFGFPFIVCVARHTAENVLRTLRARLGHDPAVERARALDEIGRITLLRLLSRIDGPGAPATAGHLSTHVLDTRLGRPAAGLHITLRQEGRKIADAATDADGRVAALHAEGPIRQGQYELVFAAGNYFATHSTPSFYDAIPVRFIVDQSEGRYHIPLLLAPYSYTTYRGS